MSFHSRFVDLVVGKPSGGSEDIYGIQTEGNPTEETFRGLVWQGETEETLRGGDTVTTRWKFIIETRSGIEADHYVKWDGMTFQVVGDPAPFQPPAGDGFVSGSLIHVKDV